MANTTRTISPFQQPISTPDIAVALNLESYFTPVESPQSNGVAEAFVKIYKRDFVRVTPPPDAATANRCHRKTG